MTAVSKGNFLQILEMDIQNYESNDHVENLIKWKHLDPRVATILEGTGFVELLQVSICKVLQRLVGVLVRAYDIESCSFVFGGKNVFFGLIDVLYITGLSICGKPVIGEEVDNQSVSLKYLGVDLCCPRRKCIKLKDLRDNFMTLPEEVSEEDLHRATRAFCLYIIGSFICPNSTNSFVNPIYLQYLENVTQIKQFAWGAALWAHLNFSLRKLKESGGSSMQGSGSCLQIFAILSLRNVAKEIKIIYKPYEALGEEFLPRHLMLQANLAKTTSAMILCNNEYAPYFVEKFPKYFVAGGDGWNLNLGGKNTRRGAKLKNEETVPKDWKTEEPYPVYVDRWNSTYGQLLLPEGARSEEEYHAPLVKPSILEKHAESEGAHDENQLTSQIDPDTIASSSGVCPKQQQAISKKPESSVTLVEVIELDSESDGESQLMPNTAVDEQKMVVDEDPESQVWFISSPDGITTMKKYSLSLLKRWSAACNYALRYKVWKEGQSEEQAIPLKDAINLASFP